MLVAISFHEKGERISFGWSCVRGQVHCQPLVEYPTEQFQLDTLVCKCTGLLAKRLQYCYAVGVFVSRHEICGNGFRKPFAKSRDPVMSFETKYLNKLYPQFPIYFPEEPPLTRLQVLHLQDTWYKKMKHILRHLSKENSSSRELKEFNFLFPHPGTSFSSRFKRRRMLANRLSPEFLITSISQLINSTSVLKYFPIYLTVCAFFAVSVNRRYSSLR